MDGLLNGVNNMQKINTMLAISLMTVSFLMGSVAGYFISPTYQQTMFVKEDMGLGKADRFVDLRYMQQMIAHHKSAILLANQVADASHREELRTLGNEIKTNEPKLIGELYDLKKKLYNDGRKIADPTVVQLGKVNNTFDLRFLNALIAHHEEGIQMTKEIKSKSSNPIIIDNADAVENFLTTTLPTLKNYRAQWFNVQ